MSAAARSVQVFSIYLILLGSVLLVAPNPLLQAFGLPPSSEVWIRVVGMLVLYLGIYYWLAAGAGFVLFLRATVLIRFAVPLFFLIFVGAGWARWPLVLFGVVDAAGATWTWLALRRPAGAA